MRARPDQISSRIKEHFGWISILIDRIEAARFQAHSPSQAHQRRVVSPPHLASMHAGFLSACLALDGEIFHRLFESASSSSPRTSEYFWFNLDRAWIVEGRRMVASTSLLRRRLFSSSPSHHLILAGDVFAATPRGCALGYGSQRPDSTMLLGHRQCLSSQVRARIRLLLLRGRLGHHWLQYRALPFNRLLRPVHPPPPNRDLFKHWLLLGQLHLYTCHPQPSDIKPSHDCGGLCLPCLHLWLHCLWSPVRL
jgi:hypothetical protein